MTTNRDEISKLQGLLTRTLLPYLPKPEQLDTEANIPITWFENLGDRTSDNDNQVLGGNKEDLAASGPFQTTFDVNGKAIVFHLVPHSDHIHISINEDTFGVESFVFEFENDESFERHKASGSELRIGVVLRLCFDAEQTSWTFRIGFQNVSLG